MNEVRLNVTGGFNWNVEGRQNGHLSNSKETLRLSTSNKVEQSCENSSEEKKARRKRKREDIVVEKDCATIVSTFDPLSLKFEDLETLDECDRLVVAFPNSSKAWLFYMVFHLKQAEIDKARNTAEKALKTICFRETREKQNIWLTLLNLENLYGTQESLMNAFQRALTYNEPKDIYNHLVDIYISSQKNQEAKELLETMTKKFKKDKDVWIKFVTFCMKLSEFDLAYELMNKSLKSVDKKSHAEIQGKFAQMECEYGNLGKGKSMFERLLQNYPKRRDILSVYINVLKKSGAGEEAEKWLNIFNNK